MAIDFYEAGRISGTMVLPAIVGLYYGNKIKNYIKKKLSKRKENEISSGGIK